MKRFILFLILLLAVPTIVSAQTVDFSVVENNQRVIVVTIEWTADGSGVATEDFNIDIEGLPDVLAGRHCYQAETIPGTGTAPTTLYDIVVSTSEGLSVFKSALSDRSATVPEDAFPRVGDEAGVYGFGVKTVWFDSGGSGDVWNFAVSNAGAGGQGLLRLFFR